MTPAKWTALMKYIRALKVRHNEEAHGDRFSTAAAAEQACACVLREMDRLSKPRPRRKR
jgi:hypothetical protein